jgi:hypothetical protein
MIHSALLQEVIEQLASLFQRNGYLRWTNMERRKAEPRTYKKGAELRLVANSKAELRTIRRLLRAVEFNPGKPFVKAKQWRQPIYGRAEVARFLLLIGESPERCADHAIARSTLKRSRSASEPK